MQAAFMDNWIKTTGRVLNGGDYYPQLQRSGDSAMHLFISSPAGGSSSMRLMYLLALSAATRSIDLEAAYFIPDRLVVDALLAARARAVRVRLLVPGRYIDSMAVRVASKRRWGPLLEAGVEIHEFMPTMMHNKMLILDGELVSVGSTNFDMRSFDLNDEASLNIYSRAFGERMTAVMEADLKRAKPYTLEMWKRRSLRQRVGERLAQPLESQL
jgi:cardiolipin synthase